MDLIDLCEAERLESLKLISHIFLEFQNSKCLNTILKNDLKFQFFLRCSLKSLLIIAKSVFPSSKTFSLKKSDNENVYEENLNKADIFAVKTQNDR